VGRAIGEKDSQKRKRVVHGTGTTKKYLRPPGGGDFKKGLYGKPKKKWVEKMIGCLGLSRKAQILNGTQKGKKGSEKKGGESYSGGG